MSLKASLTAAIHKAESTDADCLLMLQEKENRIKELESLLELSIVEEQKVQDRCNTVEIDKHKEVSSFNRIIEEHAKKICLTEENNMKLTYTLNSKNQEVCLGLFIF
jgi:hypothetical protein